MKRPRGAFQPVLLCDSVQFKEIRHWQETVTEVMSIIYVQLK